MVAFTCTYIYVCMYVMYVCLCVCVCVCICIHACTVPQVGTGFSFTGSEQGYSTNEDQVADNLYEYVM